MKLGRIADLLDSTIRAARGATELAEREPVGYSIDSRSIQENELFFAIRGEKYDGHGFVSDAIARRALAAVVTRDFIDSEFARQLDPQRAALLMVDDTLEALQIVARTIIKEWSGRVIGITGSLGKTTTKEITAAMLAKIGRTMKTAGNLNNDYGLPLSILKMEAGGLHSSDFEYAVLEMGMNHKGEIARLTTIAPPNAGVVTVVAPAHLEFFDSVDAIAEAKSEMVSGIVPGGVGVLNADDHRVARMAAMRNDIGFISFGIERDADVRAIEIERGDLTGTRFVLSTPSGKIPAQLALPGRHNLYNALAAAAVAHHFRVPLNEIAAALAEMHAPKMRGEVLRFRAGFTVIDDSYNSNPRALIEMVTTLCAAVGRSRKIVVAGEMLELGDDGPQLHRDAGRLIANLGTDQLIGVRGLAREMVEGAHDAGMPQTAAAFVETPEEAADLLVSQLRAGDLVLVKGSRGVKTEIVVERIKQLFERAASVTGQVEGERNTESLRQLA